jgi:hypothetical protein
MKKSILTLLLAVSVMLANAQLTVKADCPVFEVDILDGKVNGLKADAPNDKVKAKFPCFSSAAEEKDSAKCGTNVSFKDRDLYFYTQRDYVEIGPKFKGKLSIPLMGAARSSLFKHLGNPKVKDTSWDAFTTAYGIIVLTYDAANKVKKIQFSTKNTNNIQLCDGK